MNTKFDDIRPYIDAEIPEAMNRIADSELLPAIAKFVFPEKELFEVQKLLRSFTNIYDFQVGVMFAFNQQVISRSIDQFTYSGADQLDPAKSYLFVSNHRDIVMDSSLLQLLLYFEGIRSTEITFGSNLMSSQLIIDIGRSNKMFKVMRGENPRDFYKSTLHLSEYIRHTITEKNESIWIAQRSGRTKDGNDATDQGILKMFCMSGGKDPVQALNTLNVVPVAISYQYEPCDFFKTRELYMSRNGAKYMKEKNEDLTSVLTGITQFKGNVHINICKPLQQEELQLSATEKSPNDFYKNVANLIDRRIYSNYKLNDTNYIAHDLRSNTNTFASRYTPQSKEQFVQRYHQVLDKFETDKEIVGQIFLGIYANSVDNAM
jgi:hypothetical protein